MIIRKANALDITSILALLAEVNSGAHFNWDAEKLTTELAIAQTLVFEIENQVASFLVYREGVEFIDITVLATHPNFVRRGLQSQLLQSLKAYANEKRLSILLEVHSENRSGIELYKKNKFTNIFTRNNYYPDGKDALVFQWVCE